MPAKLPLEDGQGQQSPGLAVAPFQYSPLGAPTHIRLLDILPGNASSEVHFRLREKRLGEHGDVYHAISYTWGPPVPLHKIYSPGGFIQVTENLWEALRRYQKIDDVMTLWVDAVCVDQANVQERSQQIVLMRRIYSESKRVLVWLGLESPSDRSAFEFITRTVDYVKDKGLPSSEAMIDEMWATATEEVQVAVTDLFAKSWFRRVWTFQEIICAVEATLTSGSLDMEFLYFKIFCGILLMTGQWIWLKTKAAQRALGQMSEVKLTKDYLSQQSAENSLLELLKRTRTRLATDPRDIIYGLVAIASNTNPLPFAPTYQIAVNQLYEDFAVHVICQSESLDIFACCTFHPGPRECPSWVPDWRNLDGLTISINPKKDSFHAAGSSRFVTGPTTTTIVINHSLSVEAICLDRLQTLTSFTNSPDLLGLTHWQSDMLPRVQWQQNIITQTLKLTSSSPLYSSEPPSEERWHAWCRTMIGDKINEDDRAAPHHENHVRVWKSRIEAMSDGHLDTNRDRFAGHFAEIQFRVASMSSHRNFCLTRDEGRIGWVPFAAQRGDVVCLMRGSPVPVIIRPLSGCGREMEDEYVVIGQCYIHGIMDGEAVVGKKERWRRIQLV